MLHKARLISSKHRMSGPLADSIVLYSECFGMPSIVTEIILYHKVKRIDFCYRITMEAIPLREAFVLFPFGNSDPVFSFQGIGAPVMAFDDIIAGGNTNQYAAQHWCKVAGSDFDCVLASDEARIIEFGGINTTAVSQAHHHLNPAGWEKPYITRQDISNSHIASMILYSNCQTNFPFVQQGEVIYRYSLTTGKNVDCEGFAESFVYPPAILDGNTAPFSVDTGNGNVTVLTLKQAEDGDGMIVRLKETRSKNADVDLCKMMRGDFRFFLCDSLERTVSENSLQVYTLKPYETVTLRIKK
ncbi:MAG: hypothetical protein E7656_05490 [Ruminococcaceae bacterium]|nr:hypothetical protein [Oscillospiraceae bacterium]